MDLLSPLPATPIDVPSPADDRIRAVADALLANPADPPAAVIEVAAR